MSTTIKLSTTAGLALALVLVGGTARAQSLSSDTEHRNLTAYSELLRRDLKSERVAVITELMAFTDAEDRAFWRLYRDYERNLDKLNDERLAGIQEYTKIYERLDDATADRLAQKALDLEGQRVELKKTFYASLRKALPGKTAARYLQVENQLLLLTDLQIASSLPIVK
jgi:hypothetical protein